jgi:CRP/FNR family cyclic AMP-dependent transcriptional regulator
VLILPYSTVRNRFIVHNLLTSAQKIGTEMDYLRYKEIEEGLSDFFHCCHSKHYPAKTTIIRPGAAADTLYYIREGSVTISMENDEGEELIIAYLNQGDFLGEIGLFSEVADRSVTIRTRTECRTEEITYAQIKSLAPTKLRECYPTLLKFLAEQMARRLLASNRKASELAFLDVAGRVEAALHELSTQPDALKHPEGMQIRVTRQEISRMVGCSREMAGRVLKSLQDAGILWAHGKTMIVYDEEHREQNES